MALRLLAYQLRYNAPYARYCERLGVTPTALPSSWENIPAVPAPVFKRETIATFDPAVAAVTFETSGTTSGTGGKQYLETPALYDAALLAGFDRFVLADGARLRYFNLVPNPLDAPHSSLGYMMMRVAQQRGDARTGWYLRGDELRFEAFLRDLQEAAAGNAAVCIATTAFALVHCLEGLDAAGVELALPAGSRVMETGGFKGRSRAVTREALYGRTRRAFGLPADAIVAEYGMTELSSQYYDRIGDAEEDEPRRKVGPPWLRARVVGSDRRTLPRGETGSLLHVDLANRSTAIAVQTEDLGVQCDDGFVLLGRAGEAELRGCSLDAEDLAARGS